MAKLNPAVDADKAAIRDTAAAMIATLDTIQEYESPTSAQVIGAVKKIAEHQEKLIRHLVRNL